MHAKWMRRSAAAIAAAAIVDFVRGGVLPELPTAEAVAGPAAKGEGYRVLDPIQSGDLTLYPVVQAAESAEAAHWRYLTLDEGLRSGDVVIEEAGKARGLVAASARHRLGRRLCTAAGRRPGQHAGAGK